jgi:hypothetical protein
MHPKKEKDLIDALTRKVLDITLLYSQEQTGSNQVPAAAVNKMLKCCVFILQEFQFHHHQFLVEYHEEILH